MPPFAFDGYGGRSKYLWPVNYTDFEPRFGFAWVPKLFGWNGTARFVVRGGYGLSHAPLTGQNRLPNPNFGVPATTYSETSGQVNPNYAMRLSSNPPLGHAALLQSNCQHPLEWPDLPAGAELFERGLRAFEQREDALLAKLEYDARF